jgi:hypothetical protein
MHKNFNISANSKLKSKTHLVVNQEIRGVIVAKPVKNKKSHESEPLTRLFVETTIITKMCILVATSV